MITVAPARALPRNDSSSRPETPVDPSRQVIRLGARGSLLSRLQSAGVARQLETRFPGIQIQLITVATTGDTLQDRPLYEYGGKGLFVKELQLALLCGEVDFAVHSFKDVPVTMPLVDTSKLAIVATSAREDPRDVLACRGAASIAELPRNARVGTGSLRRQSQLLARRPDLRILPIRGNIDTRLRKLHAGDYDAVVLALSGLKRAGLFDLSFQTPISTREVLPAAGQGALALECRADNAPVRTLLASLNDPATALAVELEREVVRRLNGDCHSPIGALAEVSADRVSLTGVVARRDGLPPVIRANVEDEFSNARQLPGHLVERLRHQGAAEMLA